MNERTAVLLIAHGSRRAEANDELVRLAKIIQRTHIYPVIQTAYLELVEPGISRAAEECVAAGVTRVKMLPYFLSAGAHVTEDLERHRQELAVRFPQVAFELCSPLGLHPLIVEIVMDRLRAGASARNETTIEGSGQAIHAGS
jgi:sirohydrochlorin ferrochelatase